MPISNNTLKTVASAKLLFKFVPLAILIAMLFAAFFFFTGSRMPMINNDNGAQKLIGITYETGNDSGKLTLPTIIKNLPPQTSVTLYAQVPQGQDSLLLKSVFAKTKLYINDTLAYEFGMGESYPRFMNDPPTDLAIITLPEGAESTSLRIEYISPTQRTELSLPAIYTGSEGELIAMMFHVNGYSLLFSLMLIFIGMAISAVSLGFVRKIAGGTSFLWLGFFSLSAGIWVLGECDLSAFLIPYPQLLYAMAYLGLFSLTIPFLRFGIVLLKPKNRLPILVMLYTHRIALMAALLLQFTGAVDFMKFLYLFHVIVPLAFIVFALDLLWEYFRYGNQNAKRFALATILMTAAVVLELINYWLKLTDAVTVMFQLGMLCFIIMLGIESGRYVREAMKAVAENLRLEFEVNAAQERERRLSAENAMLDSLSRMKSDYLANISHEMKTPLTIMSGYAQQTEEELEEGEANKQTIKNLRIIQAEAHRLAELAGQVLYSTKNIQTGISIISTKISDILEQATAVCTPILAKNRNHLETVCEEDCPNTAANLDMIVQVLVNLCSNAGRHTKNGVVSITAKQAGTFIEFAVRDNGNGIAPELFPFVFERGVSGDDATGLGLSICKDIINQHGGEIDIDSEIGKGTRVIFTLPVFGKGEKS